jgi:hypothetical protein
MINARSWTVCRVTALIGLAVTSPRPVIAGGFAPGAVVCLHRAQLPFTGGIADARRTAIEQRLAAALTRESFTVVEPDRVVAVHERVLKAAGGFFDPATGVVDGARYRAVGERLARAFATELHCDVRLVPSVEVVRAHFDSGVAQWDGATQQVSSTGRIVLNVLTTTIESGWVGAFSLWLRLVDLNGEEIAFRSAGIEALVQLAVLEDKDLMPQDQWLTDDTKLDAAIASALGAGGSTLRTSVSAD